MVYLIIVLATLTRFIPHAWNFSPVYGALLFGGANMKKRDSIWFSAMTLGASDVVLTKFIYHYQVGWGELIQSRVRLNRHDRLDLAKAFLRQSPRVCLPGRADSFLLD